MDYSKEDLVIVTDGLSKDKYYYIRINNQLIQVSKEVYTEIYNSYRKELRFIKDNKRFGHLSLDKQYSNESFLIDHIKGTDDVVRSVRTNEEIAYMLKALSQLSDNEKVLVEQLFIKEKTSAEVSRELGVAQQTISKKKQRIIKKMKKVLEKGV